MNEFRQGTSPEAKIEKPKKITREEIETRLAHGENLENLDMKDLDLAGLDFEGRSFRVIPSVAYVFTEKNEVRVEKSLN